MEPIQTDGGHRPRSPDETFPFLRLPRQEDAPNGRVLADPFQPHAPLPSSQLPNGQRVQASRNPQNPPDRAADTVVAHGDRSATAAEDESQHQLPQYPQFLLLPIDPRYLTPQFLAIASHPAYSAGDRTPTPRSPLIPPLTVSTGDRTPTAESPRTPTVEASSIPPLSLGTGNKTPTEDVSRIPQDDIDPCSPTLSTGSEVSIGDCLPEYI
ncbi:hypothetical protein AA0118_g8728 [Alternaria tenuissima]|uniref:Uncharacterized protein n=1 Tax=Alternaria tenuissima TaxID=119927 RepID=A0AB37WD64_9PLEO|nr:hypothetical protein AA0115_g7071 [Alternaria tenuissima]RYN55542.1 hypothetical protein AA0118_g8728 [Alternaria tenuissima]